SPQPSSAGCRSSSWLLPLEAVAHAPYVDDEPGVAGVRFDLLADALDVDRDRVPVAHVAPEALDELFVGEHLAGTLGEQAQQVELPRTERHQLPIHPHLSRPYVQRQAPEV